MDWKREPLETRKEMVASAIPSDALQGIATSYGKDAVMAFVLDALELSDRTGVEKLAEIAFDLVPGSVEHIHKTHLHRVEVTLPDEPSFRHDPGDVVFASFRSAQVYLNRWQARADFGYEPETRTLFVYYP